MNRINNQLTLFYNNNQNSTIKNLILINNNLIIEIVNKILRTLQTIVQSRIKIKKMIKLIDIKT